MKKIPTLFERVFENHKIVDITDKITPGCEEAFLNGIATIKVDGSCCAIINGEFYKRYDAKKGKKPPEGAIPCCDPDPVTGHWPHWVKVDFNAPEDKWYATAFNNTVDWSLRKDGVYSVLPDGTYEAIGPHFNGNPYDEPYDMLEPHGFYTMHDVERTFEGVKDCLRRSKIEGIVFWLNNEPVCKIKRSDFGFEWPVKEVEDVD